MLFVLLARLDHVLEAWVTRHKTAPKPSRVLLERMGLHANVNRLHSQAAGAGLGQGGLGGGLRATRLGLVATSIIVRLCLCSSNLRFLDLT